MPGFKCPDAREHSAQMQVPRYKGIRAGGRFSYRLWKAYFQGRGLRPEEETSAQVKGEDVFESGSPGLERMAGMGRYYPEVLHPVSTFYINSLFQARHFELRLRYPVP